MEKNDSLEPRVSTPQEPSPEKGNWLSRLSGRSKAWIILAAAIIYDLSPLDIIPDIPGVGWVDDFFFTATATMNLLQQECKDSYVWLEKIFNLLKWILIVVGIIAILLLLILGTVLVSLFQS